MKDAAFALMMVAAAVAVGSMVTDSHALRLACMALTAVAGVCWFLTLREPEPLAPVSEYQGLDQ